MFNAQELLGVLMQGTLTASSPRRVEHALHTQGPDQPGGSLAQLLGGSGPRGETAQPPGSGLAGLVEVAQGLLGRMRPPAAPPDGPPTASTGLAALAGAFFGGGQGATGGSAGGGAMALLSGLAFSALGTMGQEPASAPAHTSPAVLPLGLRRPATGAEEEALASHALVMLKAMINAAKADGEVDDSERQRIADKLAAAGADPEAQAFVQQEIQGPLDLAGLVHAASTPQQAAEIYAASLLAIEVDTVGEQAYLRRLAQGLGLDAHVIQRLHVSLGVA